MEVVPARRSALLILSLRQSYLHQSPSIVFVRSWFEEPMGLTCCDQIPAFRILDQSLGCT